MAENKAPNRSGREPGEPDRKKKDIFVAGGEPPEEGKQHHVPEENRPGHHPRDEEDKPKSDKPEN